MLRRTIPSFLLLVLLVRAAAQESACVPSDPLPAYSTALALGASVSSIKAEGAPALPQAASDLGALVRFGLSDRIFARGGAGLRYAAQSAFSPLGVAYRPFLSAWLEASFGILDPRVGIGAELSAFLHSGGTPGSYAAQGMAGGAFSVLIRGSERRSVGKATSISAAPYRAELSFPLGFLVRSDSLSLYAGLGVRLWRESVRGEEAP